MGLTGSEGGRGRPVHVWFWTLAVFLLCECVWTVTYRQVPLSLLCGVCGLSSGNRVRNMIWTQNQNHSLVCVCLCVQLQNSGGHPVLGGSRAG